MVSAGPGRVALAHLFPLMARAGPLEALQQLGASLGVRLARRDLEIAAPFGGVEAPVDSPVFAAIVRMRHKVLGSEHQVTLEALDDTLQGDIRGSPGAGSGTADSTVALPETLVVNFEHGAFLGRRGSGVFGRRGGLLGRGGREAPGQQGGAQALGVRLRDEAAGRRAVGQDARGLQRLQLLRVAPAAEDLEVVADGVDLREREVPEHTVEHLGQAQALLAAHHKARDRLALQDRLGPLGAALVGRRQDGDLLDGERRRVEEGVRDGARGRRGGGRR